MTSRLLLDSELLLWALAAPARLSRPLRRMLDESEVYASAASVLEIGLVAERESVAGDVVAALEPTGFRVLAVTAEHAAIAATLDSGIRNPLDRVLLAQAGVEDLLLVTSDTALAAAARRSRPNWNRRPARLARRRTPAGHAAQAVRARILLANELDTRGRHN